MAQAETFVSHLVAMRSWPTVENRYRPEILGLLDRWIERRDEAEQMWKSIASTNKIEAQFNPREFIASVILLWVRAQETKRVVDGSPGLERTLRNKAKALFNEESIGDVIEAAGLKGAAIAFNAQRRRLLGRKQGEAHREQFMGACAGMLEQNCGQPFLRIVATLTEILFDCDPVDIDAVRHARKRRDIRTPK